MAEGGLGGGGGQSHSRREAGRRVERFVRATDEPFPELLNSLPLYHHVLKRLRTDKYPYDWNQAVADNGRACVVQETLIFGEHAQILQLQQLRQQRQQQPQLPDQKMQLRFDWMNYSVMFLMAELFVDLIARGIPWWMRDDLQAGLGHFRLWETALESLEAYMVNYEGQLGSSWSRRVIGMYEAAPMVDACRVVVRETKAELLRRMDSYKQAHAEDTFESLSLG